MRKNKFIKRRQDSMKTTVTLLILIIVVGYAFLQSNLNINGTANLGNPRWDIHWENIQVKSGSVDGSNVVTAPTIDTAETTVTYSVILPTPGSYYEFTVDAVNSGTIDGMIDSISSKLNGVTITNLPEYLSYTVTYSDGTPLAINQELKTGTQETYKLVLKYRDDIALNQMPASDQTLSLEFTVKYRQANDDAQEITPSGSFAEDDWATIITSVQSGNTNQYNVGDTKEVDMGTFGTHTLRIANKSTPSECSNNGFSQTACGFVLEFEDIIDEQKMNSSSTNVGGWESSSLRTYLNSTIYDALPANLKSGIISTYVVSGHGKKSGETNFITNDKLYLLSTKEVWGKEGTTNVCTRDTAEEETRQLDYYKQQGVKTDSNNGAIKKRGNVEKNWWLRTADSADTDDFIRVNDTGHWGDSTANVTNHVSPAFRIG